jgi:hypothetical protein
MAVLDLMSRGVHAAALRGRLAEDRFSNPANLHWPKV